MIIDIIAFAAAAFVGWNCPQPMWAQRAQAWMRGKVADFFEDVH
jgi:hypothetical protein